MIQMHLGTLLLLILLVSCGSQKDEPRDYKASMPMDLGFWSPGQTLPSWLIKNGSYESPCLTEPPFTDADGKPFGGELYFKTTLIFNFDVLERNIHFYKDAACRESRQLRGERSIVSQAYRTAPDTATGQSYISYQAYEGPSLTQSKVYLSQIDADFLNKHKICRDNWVAESLNDVMGLNKEECEAAIEAIPNDGFERTIAQLIMIRLTPYSEFSGFSIVARETSQGISVRSGSGLTNQNSEYVFKRVD